MLAIPVFRSRVAPVFNWCSKIFIIPEKTTDRALGHEVVLLHMNPFDRLRILREQGVNTLICGALSPDLITYGKTLGLHIVYDVAGDIDDVLRAFHQEQLDQPCYWLPGCRKRRQHRKGKRLAEDGSKDSRDSKNSTRSTTRESERTTSHGDKRQRSDLPVKRGSRMPRPQGRHKEFCICPQCGAEVRHERGRPCSQVRCPQCDRPMIMK